MKKYKFKAPNRTVQLLQPYIFSVHDAEDCCAEIMAKVEQYANK